MVYGWWTGWFLRSHHHCRQFVGAQSGVISNTKGNGEQLIGAPAINPKVFFKARALDAKLPDMYRQIAQLQRELDELKKIVEIEK